MTVMQTVTNQIRESLANSSFIRKMFEKGIELRRQYGDDAVCDFSLGNPDVPPPAAAKAALERIAADAVKPLGLGYCPRRWLYISLASSTRSWRRRTL